jgi:hypothetical protein
MAGIGPFDSFSFPDVYTRTLNEAPNVTAAGSLRFPAFIGVADEVKPIDNYEMIRGSSSLADNLISQEDVSDQFTGANRNFTVTFFPVVSGDGSGTVTTDPSKVTVLVNGDPVPVSSVNGDTGEIYLVSIPASGDTVLCTYYFKRKDELHTNEDLSDQVDGVRTIFRTHYTPIVQGNNGGITTTDPANVIAKVDNVVVTVDAVDGDTGLITLATAPALSAVLTVTYYSNEWQDTADILPSPRVSAVRKVGYAPGTSDFVDGVDFVLDTTGDFSTLNWGASIKTTYGQHTIATTYFDAAQITTTLFDNRNFRRSATGTADGTNATFVIEATPTVGDGMAIPTDNPDLVTAYYGTSPADATVIDVIQVNAAAKTVTLNKSALADTSGKNIYVTQYSNLLPDDNWTLSCTVAGAAGVGAYTMSGLNSGVAMNTLWSTSDTTVADPDFASENVTYPAGTGSGNSDAQVIPGYAVAETVYLTFTDSTVNASKYIVTSSNPVGTGSNGDNTGYLNQTYVDKKTGFRVTVNTGSSVIYVTGDKIGYTVSPTFVVGTVPTGGHPTRAMPGVRINVTNTTGVGVGDTALINTYNKSGAEPNVGDYYYVSFDETKEFDANGMIAPKLYTLENDVIADMGPLSINNKLGMAAHLAFLNGAQAVALLQIQKTTGGDDAPDSRYISGIQVFDEPMAGGDRPSLMEPLTTSTAVMSYLKTSNTIQSGIRYANERMSYFGFSLGTSPTTAQTYARSMNSERMIAVYPDGAITTITDYLGNDVEYLVDGALLAAALAGRDVSPQFDVAEPITKKPIVGFTRLYRRMDSVTTAQTANAGITVLEEQAAGIVIKFGLTTDLSSVLTRTPSVIKIKDFVQKGARSALEQYIGQKFLVQKTKEIEQSLGSYLGSLQGAQIITGYTGVKASPDPADPTIVRVEAFYSPVFPLLWIVITFNLRSSV